MGCDWFYPVVVYGLALRTAEDLTIAQASAILRALRRARLADSAQLVQNPILGDYLSPEQMMKFKYVVIGKEVASATDLTPLREDESWEALAKRLSASMAPLGVEVSEKPFLHAGTAHSLHKECDEDGNEDEEEENGDAQAQDAATGTAASSSGSAAVSATSTPAAMA